MSRCDIGALCQFCATRGSFWYWGDASCATIKISCWADYNVVQHKAPEDLSYINFRLRVVWKLFTLPMHGMEQVNWHCFCSRKEWLRLCNRKIGRNQGVSSSKIWSSCSFSKIFTDHKQFDPTKSSELNLSCMLMNIFAKHFFHYLTSSAQLRASLVHTSSSILFCFITNENIIEMVKCSILLYKAHFWGWSFPFSVTY